jgi:hypothetical protein
MSGLELINIKILEYAQQNLANIAEATRPWSAAALTKISDLYSKTFLSTELFMEYAGYTYNDILVKFAEEYTKEAKTQDVIATLIFVAWIILIVLGFLYIWFRYIQDLSKNIWRIQGMLSMIPLEIVLANKRMKAQFSAGGLAKGVR